MKPQDVLKHMQRYEKAVKTLAAGGHVAVGVTKESASREIYEGGVNAVEIGARHEYGHGVPRRSFLRLPTSVKREEIKKTQDLQHKAIFDNGRSGYDALSFIGIKAKNIILGAFTSRGYGKWLDISAETKAAKGSSQALVDTGILKNSITHEVRL